MRKLVTLAILSAVTAPSFAVTLNFDDLTGGGAMPSGYGGVSNWVLWNYYDSPQFPYNPTSGATRIYTTGTGEIDFGQNVVFDGAWFNGYGTVNGFGPIHYDMYLGGNLVATSGQIDLDGSGNAMHLSSGYNGAIDRVDVRCPNGNFFIMDDFTYRVVPEPVSMIALGAGLAAIARKRRKN